uniref:(California timema) hypothetical protein n=1 Tax=Timema californicum TaxID=61474 RepID=A0A7R9J638_TIMCA|nr:unnamed protein product [Timema californicum]
MNYNNSQGRYPAAVSPGHYGSLSPGQHGSYPGPQPWSQQQTAEYSPVSGGPGPVVSGSPSGTPSPAHTPPATMSGGQFHPGRQGPPSWGQQVVPMSSSNRGTECSVPGMGLHPGAAPSQAPGYYPAPHPSLVGPGVRGAMQGPPQHAHMSSSADRLSPGTWSKPVPPPSSHGGQGNPLFSLQMLVNQDMNRAAAAAAQATSYRGQQESVDLSSAGGDAYARIPQQVGPLPLTRTDKQQTASSEHAGVRNGTIITPLNGEVNSDSSPPTCSPVTENVSVIAQTPPRDKPKPVPATSPPILVDLEAKVEDRPETLKQVIKLTSTEDSGVSSICRYPEDNLSVPSPSMTSPVQSPKSGSIKRVKKVDSILESLVESGGAKLFALAPESTAVVTPVAASVIVSPATANEDSGSWRDSGPPSPALSRPKSPCAVREEDVVSPSFSEDGKPRRKRKLDTPVRVSKTASDTETDKPEDRETIVKPDDSEDCVIIEKESDDRKQEEEEEDEDEEDEGPSLPTTAEPVSARGMDTVCREIITSSSKPDMVRRRRSSDSSTFLPHVTTPVPNQKTRRKSESDQQLDEPESLLCNLVSEPGNKGGTLAKEDSKTFIEVETELEKMFAGIEETKVDTEEDPLKLEPEGAAPNLKLTETPVDKPSLSSSLKRVRTRASKPGSRRLSETIFGSSSTETTPRKKKKRQLKMSPEDSPGSAQMKKSKKSKLFQAVELNTTSTLANYATEAGLSGSLASSSCDSSRFRGPMVHVEGPRDSPYRVTVINGLSGSLASSSCDSSRFRGPMVHVEGPRDSPYRVTVINGLSRWEDEEAGERGGSKKQLPTGGRRKNASLHDLEYRVAGKVSRTGAGMYTSTLSARYDSLTPDTSWVCVFCKHGPHAGAPGLGDLFGPYLIGRECVGPWPGCDPGTDEQELAQEQRKGGRNKRSLRKEGLVEQFQHRMGKKLRRSQSMEQAAPVLGMIPIFSEGKDDRFEVWVHESCVVWASGVHLVGARIVGLQEAVWGSLRTMCDKCGEGGANIACVHRGCELRMHVGCAQEHGWENGSGHVHLTLLSAQGKHHPQFTRQIRTSISLSSAVELNTTSALTNYATEAEERNETPEQNETDDLEEIEEMFLSILGLSECDREDTESWLQNDIDDPGYQIMNEDEIALTFTLQILSPSRRVSVNDKSRAQKDLNLHFCVTGKPDKMNLKV